MAYYFSRIRLDLQHPKARDVASQFASLDGEHHSIWRKFFPKPDDAQRDFLFRRLDPAGDRAPTYYVLSQRVPIQISPAWDIQTRDYAPAISQGMNLRFDLRASPTVTRKEGDAKSRRQHIDVVMDAKHGVARERGYEKWSQLPEDQRPQLYDLIQPVCTQWLRRRGKRLGFSLLHEPQVHAYGRHQLPRKGDSNIVLSTVDFSGGLRIDDVNAFAAAVYDGIGRGKAFGCGLLLIKPAQ